MCVKWHFLRLFFVFFRKKQYLCCRLREKQTLKNKRNAKNNKYPVFGLPERLSFR